MKKQKEPIENQAVPGYNVCMEKLRNAVLPLTYDNYIFDLYGTLVDIRTEEDNPQLWQKLALFYGYYGAGYTPRGLQEAYQSLVQDKVTDEFPEVDIADVFVDLFVKKGVKADRTLAVHAGQFFRIESTEYIRVYPGTEQMLASLQEQGKKVYLLSNAQRIFTAYEMQYLGISKYFDGILISSDYRTKKPEARFFQALKDKYAVGERGTLFIGNDPYTDLCGAKNAGFAAFYVHSNISPSDALPEARLRADYMVEDFKEWSI